MVLGKVYWEVDEGAIWGLNLDDRNCPGTIKRAGRSQLVTRFHTQRHWHTPTRPNCGWTPHLGICTRGVQLQISRGTVLLNHNNTSVTHLGLLKQMKRFIECAE